MRISDVSVRGKIAGALIGVMIATVALGAFSVVRLSELNARAADIRDNWLQAIGYLGKYQYAETRLRTYHITTILASSDAERATIASNIAKLEPRAADNWAKYEAKISNNEERALAERIKAAQARYNATVDELRGIVKDKGTAAATQYSLGAMRSAFNDLAAAIEADIDFNIASGNASAARGADTFYDSRLWIIVAIGLCVLLCGGAGFVLITGVSTPLGRMTAAMGELAAGHLDTHVPHADQRDEIGKLAEAMTAFKNELAAAERSKAEQTDLIVTSIGAGIDQLAKGDLTHRVTAELSGPFAKLKGDFNGAVERLQDTLSGVLTATSSLTGGAGEISNAADDLSRRRALLGASLE